MKGLIIMSDLFEDVEAIATIDVLKRAGIDLCVAKVFDNKEVISSHGIKYYFDEYLNDVDYKSFDFLVLPGGPGVFKFLHENKLVNEIIYYFGSNHKEIYAICAAPSLVGKFGFYENNNYTVFPGCGGPITLGNYVDEPVVISNNFISARSMYYANDFALAIVEKLLGKDKKDALEKEIKGIR